MLKSLGTAIHYCHPEEEGEYEIRTLVFSDGSGQDLSVQLGLISRIAIGNFEKGSLFYSLTWAARTSQRPVISIDSAESISAVIAVDQRKLLVIVHLTLLNISAKKRICVDSEDF